MKRAGSPAGGRNRAVTGDACSAGVCPVGNGDRSSTRVRTAIRAAGAQRSSGGDGFILVEVLVALVLLAVLIVPLVTGMTAAVDRAATVRAREGERSAATNISLGAEAWTWGPRVLSVSWTPGVVPVITVEQGGLPGSTVGLWIDGWFLGEWTPDENGEVEIRPFDWPGDRTDVAGEELVARVRCTEGAWGPPCRSLISGQAGGQTLSAVGEAGVADGAVGGATTDACTLIHVPGLANPSVATSGAGAPLEADRLGLMFCLPPVGRGVCDAALDGSTQSWKTEEGRALDVYF